MPSTIHEPTVDNTVPEPTTDQAFNYSDFNGGDYEYGDPKNAFLPDQRSRLAVDPETVAQIAAVAGEVLDKILMFVINL